MQLIRFPLSLGHVSIVQMQESERQLHGTNCQRKAPLPCDEDSKRINAGVLPATTADLDVVCWQATAKSRATIRDMFLVPSVMLLSAELSAPQRLKAWSRRSVMPFPIWWRIFCQVFWVRCCEQKEHSFCVCVDWHLAIYSRFIRGFSERRSIRVNVSVRKLQLPSRRRRKNGTSGNFCVFLAGRLELCCEI